VHLQLGADLAGDLLLAAVSARFLELLEQTLHLAMIFHQKMSRVLLAFGH
jgi:hypothetical protein